MKRVAGPVSPFLVLALTAMWLLLNQTLAPAHIALGAALAVALAWSGSALRPLRARVRRLDIALGLALVVLCDIVRSSVRCEDDETSASGGFVTGLSKSPTRNIV